MDASAKQLDERKLQVFNLHSRFNSEPMFSIRKRVYGSMVRAGGCNWPEANATAPDQNDLFAFVEFFDVVDVCVSSGLCDEGLVQRMFVPYANGHWEILRDYANSVRRGEQEMSLPVQFGIGLERLATKPVKLKCTP